MSFSNNPPRRKAGGGMFFLIVLAVGAFILFSNMNGGTGTNPGRDVDNLPSQGAAGPDYSDRDRDENNAGSKMPTTGRSGAAGDWAMEDAGTQTNTGAKSGKTQKGDWAIEDVDTKNKNDNQFQFNNPDPKAPPKKNGGDWSIEDVGGKQKSKTEKGDWAIEDAGSSKK